MQTQDFRIKGLLTRWSSACVAIICLFTAGAGCKIVGFDNDDDSRPRAAVEGVIEVDPNLDPAKVGVDSFDLESAELDRRTLSIRVTYSGGCGDHDFRLLTPGANILSLPPGADLYLVHEDNDDPCDAIIQAMVSFDITPLVQNSGFSQIILHLWRFDLSGTLEPLLFSEDGT